jgi:hypothetical protein
MRTNTREEELDKGVETKNKTKKREQLVRL